MRLFFRYSAISVSIAVALGISGCAGQRQVPIADSDAVNAPKTEITPTLPTPTYAPPATPRPTATPEVRSIEFSDDRKFLAVGTLAATDPATGTIAVRDCATNRIVRRWNVAGGVRFLTWSPQGKHIAAIGATNQLLVWNWKTGRLIRTAKLDVIDQYSARTPLDYAPDGRAIAVGLDDILLFNTRTWKRSKMGGWRVDNLPTLNAGIRFSPAGHWLATSDGFEGETGYRIRSMTGGKTRHIPEGDIYGPLIFSRDDRLFAGTITQDDDSYVFTYDLRKSKIARKFKSGFEKFKADNGSQLFFTPQSFSPNARFIAGVRSEDKTGNVEIWNIETGKLAQKFKHSVRAVVWLDAKTLLAGDENGIEKLRVNTNRPLV